MRPPLTDRQRQTYDFICKFYLEKERFPTSQEVADGTNRTKTPANVMVRKLVELGYIKEHRMTWLQPVIKEDA